MMRLVGLALILVTGWSEALWVAKKRGNDPFHNECGVDVDDRSVCGRSLFGELECLAKNCCWDDNPKLPVDAIRCFVPKRMLFEEENLCNIQYEAKDDCGRYGITEGECVNVKGCCYRPATLPNEPDCFYPISVRLINGTSEKSGRVEVQHRENGQKVWGTVCGDGFDNKEADVICKNLGYKRGIAKLNAYFGEGTLDILLDDLKCKGHENRLEECKHNGWGEHNCGHQEDAGVICLNEGEEEPESEESEESEEDGSGNY